jgi:glycosyltransferase involved in cell wall biosynthesis
MMRRHPKILFGVLPNGFRVPALLPKRSEPEILTLLFVGFLQYLPNEDGILFFSNEVLPLIRRRLRLPFRLLVVGRKPPKAVLDLDRIPEVTVIGDVPEVEPYYQSATMAIVPIRFGGGTRIKILEAMALGCPVVSTTLGAEGIEVSNGENILLADTATEIADACIRLAEDKMLRANLSQKGWEMINANYSADAVAGRLADCIRAIPVNKNGTVNVGGAPVTSNTLITENS